jgi:hypothetical protein
MVKVKFRLLVREVCTQPPSHVGDSAVELSHASDDAIESVYVTP